MTGSEHMSGKAPVIRVLPPHLVNRIAAGEVVERPASVVKELVENALDAGATKIEVLATAGGRTIRVADNGCGIDRESLPTAFLNHATSKLTDDADLSAIQTLGFRGEALASISSIARVSCLSRTMQAQSGTRLVIEGGSEPVLSDTGCAQGTILEINDLFFNTPARLKFLRRPQTELAHVEEAVQALALSHPDARIGLTLNDKQVFSTSGSGDLKVLMEEVFRLRKDTEHFIAVNHVDPDVGFALRGLICEPLPSLLKNNRQWIYTFINQRSVRCPVFMKAAEAAYESLVPSGKHPFVVLFLELPFDEVDVNVHPTKKEVRYVQPNAIFSFVKQALLTALQAHGVQIYQQPTESYPGGNAAFDRAFSSFPSSGGNGENGVGWGPSYRQPAFGPSLPPGQSQQAMAFYAPGNTETQTPFLEPKKETMRVIGQLLHTFILLETPQGLMVVDQHIASERTFFEALQQNVMTESPAVQKLMTSRPFEFSPSQTELLLEKREAFKSLGFEYEAMSDNAQTFCLTSVPLIYQDRQNPYTVFESLLKQLEETGQMKPDVDHLIATLACHSAVRAGDVLTHDEMFRVIERWLACKLPWTCPHGRPIAHTIRKEELNRFFERPSLPVNA